MKIVAAYLLSVLGCNPNPSAADIKSILNSVGAEADDPMIDLLLEEASGKDITELIASGREKLASLRFGAGAVAAEAASGAPSGALEEAAETKEENVEIVEEVEEEDMIFGLFD